MKDIIFMWKGVREMDVRWGMLTQGENTYTR